MLIGIFDPMGAQSDRLRCEVCQNLILSPMNTGFLRYAVATALTVYGIETLYLFHSIINNCFFGCNSTYRLRYWNKQFGLRMKIIQTSLQQHLPFTVLKHFNNNCFLGNGNSMLQQHLPFTVLKLCYQRSIVIYHKLNGVATALTVYGIET